MRCARAPVVTIALSLVVACGPRPDRPIDAGQMDTIVVSAPPAVSTALGPPEAESRKEVAGPRAGRHGGGPEGGRKARFGNGS
jgi:hypothetical protein